MDREEGDAKVDKDIWEPPGSKRRTGDMSEEGQVGDGVRVGEVRLP